MGIKETYLSGMKFRGGRSLLPTNVLRWVGLGGAMGSPSSLLTVSTTTAQTGANTDETTLWEWSLPADTLTVNGAGFSLEALIMGAANTNAKTVRVYINDQLLVERTNSTSGVPFQVTGFLLRTSATLGVGGIAMTAVNRVVITPTVDWSEDAVIRITGQNGSASDGDIVFSAAIVEALIPPQ